MRGALWLALMLGLLLTAGCQAIEGANQHLAALPALAAQATQDATTSTMTGNRTCTLAMRFMI